MIFWCLRFPPKIEQKLVDLRYHSIKDEFFRSFFGGNRRHQKPFRNYQTNSFKSILTSNSCVISRIPDFPIWNRLFVQTNYLQSQVLITDITTSDFIICIFKNYAIFHFAAKSQNMVLLELVPVPTWAISTLCWKPTISKSDKILPWKFVKGMGVNIQFKILCASCRH